MPHLELLGRLRADVGRPIELEVGPTVQRRLVPILGGEFDGPRLNARVVPGGADIQLVHADGRIEIAAQYVLEADDGTRIFVRNDGLRRPAQADDQVPNGVPTVPYFRMAARFETMAPAFRWLTQSLFLASGKREEAHVELAFYRWR